MAEETHPDSILKRLEEIRDKKNNYRSMKYSGLM